MFSDVEQKIKRKNKILFNRDSRSLEGLRALIADQDHRTLVLWALDCATIPLDEVEKAYPNEMAPRNAMALSYQWARGEIKMPIAKSAILDCHAVAKKIDDKGCGTLCHAIGHACATVHVETHALGLPFYELTAIVMKNGYQNYQQEIFEKIDFYINRLTWWQQNRNRLDENWAKFLLREGQRNKEKLLLQKNKKG